MDLVNGDLIAQYEGWYTKELGVEVEIIKFDSGKDVNSAIASGSIDIGQLGTSPAALAISNGLDIEVFWVGDIIGTADTNVVRKAYADANPEVVTKFVELQLKANEIINTDPDKAAEEIAAQLEISKEDAADQITQFTYLNADEQIEQLDNGFSATLKDTADFLVEQKSINSAPELSEFDSRVTSEFVKKAAGK